MDEKIYLREIQLSDVETIVQWKNDKLLRKMSIGLDTEITYDNQKEDVESSMDDVDQLYYMVCLTDHIAIGYIRINWLDIPHTHGWLRFGLGSHRGQGYAKVALKLLIEPLIRKGLHRIEAEVYDYNERSYKLLESLEFKREGIKREAHFEAYEYSNVFVYGLLSKDYVIND